MSTFICTVCQNKIKEHGSNVDCGYYNGILPMIEDTTKLWDKSFLCPRFVHVKERDEKTCKSKLVFKYRYDALRYAAKAFKRSGIVLVPYRCRVCHSWHLTSHRYSASYDPIAEFERAKEKLRLFD